MLLLHVLPPLGGSRIGPSDQGGSIGGPRYLPPQPFRRTVLRDMALFLPPEDVGSLQVALGASGDVSPWDR